MKIMMLDTINKQIGKTLIYTSTRSMQDEPVVENFTAEDEVSLRTAMIVLGEMIISGDAEILFTEDSLKKFTYLRQLLERDIPEIQM